MDGDSTDAVGAGDSVVALGGDDAAIAVGCGDDDAVITVGCGDDSEGDVMAGAPQAVKTASPSASKIEYGFRYFISRYCTVNEAQKSKL